MDNDVKIYEQAMKRIDDLVDEVIQTCYDVADQNHYEKEWVLEQFRDAFNKAKRLGK
jgi:Leu/Phe-tRNA-protein transferase